MPKRGSFNNYGGCSMKKEHPTFGCSFDIDRIGDSPKLFVGINPPSYDYVMTARTFGHAQASLACRSLILPVLLRLADVALVAELSHALCLGEELLGLVRISLLNRQVTNLTEQEVVEVLPVRLLRVE